MRNLRKKALIAGLLASLAVVQARADDSEPCMTELQGSAFAKVLRFDGGVVHVDQKSPRFVKARVIGPQKYLVEYRSTDKPSAPVFTGVLTLSAKGRLVGFVVENPSGQTVRDCGPKSEAAGAKPTPTPSPSPTPSPVITPTPTPTPASSPTPVPIGKPKPTAPAPEPEPTRIEIETENGD